MTRISDEIGDTFGLYAMYGAIIAKRLANNMISGFQSAFTIDEKTRTAYFRDRGSRTPGTGATRGPWRRSSRCTRLPMTIPKSS